MHHAAGHELKAQRLEHMLRTGAPITAKRRGEQARIVGAQRTDRNALKATGAWQRAKAGPQGEVPPVRELPPSKGLSPTQRAAGNAVGSVLAARANVNKLRQETDDPEKLRPAMEAVKGRYRDAQNKLKAARREQGAAKVGKAGSKTTASSYLSEPINFGGQMMPRGEAISRMQKEGHSQANIDRYMQGVDAAKAASQRAASTPANRSSEEMSGKAGPTRAPHTPTPIEAAATPRPTPVAPTPAPKLSLKDQAAAARSAKGTPADRQAAIDAKARAIKAKLSARIGTLAEKPHAPGAELARLGKRANAADRRTSDFSAWQERKRAAEAKGQATAAPAAGASTPATAPAAPSTPGKPVGGISSTGQILKAPIPKGDVTPALEAARKATDTRSVAETLAAARERAARKQAAQPAAARPLSEQLADIPENIKIPVEHAIHSRMGTLQKLRQARFMATVESGKDAGKVDRGALKDERASRGLTAEKIRGQRKNQAETLGEFREAAPRGEVDPNAVIGHFRQTQKQELKSQPQFLNRGAGYYPSAAEAARAKNAKAAADRAGGDPMRERLRAMRQPAEAAPASPAPATPAPVAPAPGFSLKQDSSVGKPSTTFENTGGTGKPGFMFDMKKGDLPGQTSMFDKVGTVPTHPKPASPPATPQPNPAQQRRALSRVLPKVSGGSPQAMMQRAETDLDKRGKFAARLKQLRSEAAKARKDPASHTNHAPGTITPLNPSLIHADPERFQFKLGSAAGTGSVGSLAGVKKWNPDLAGVVQVWKDPANGRTYIVNGHNRLDLAKRAGAGKINAQFIDAANAEHAKAKGALANIAEGRGTSIDAANFFMGSGIGKADLEHHGIPMREKVASEGLALSQTPKPLFNRVVEGAFPAQHAAMIGGSGLTHAQQMAVAKQVDKLSKGRPMGGGHLKELLDNAREAGSVKTHSFDLFGPNEEETSLALHRAKVQSEIRDRLSREKRLFGTVAKSRAASDLARAGNVINAAESGKVSQEAGNTLDVFDQLKNRSGTDIPRHLNRAAERIHAGENPRSVIQETYGHVLNEARRILGGGEGQSAA